MRVTYAWKKKGHQRHLKQMRDGRYRYPADCVRQLRLNMNPRDCVRYERVEAQYGRPMATFRALLDCWDSVHPQEQEQPVGDGVEENHAADGQPKK